MDVRFQLTVFEIIPFLRAVSRDGNAEGDGLVLQFHPVDTGHGPRNRCAYKPAQIPMSVNPRCPVCIAVIRFSLHHDAGTVITAAGHIAYLPATNYLGEVFFSAEQNLYVFVQTSASIEAGVDDDSFAFVILAQDIAVDVAV